MVRHLFGQAEPSRHVNATDGQNQLRGDNCDSDYNGVNRMGAGGNGTANAGPGLKFDAGFTADY